MDDTSQQAVAQGQGGQPIVVQPPAADQQSVQQPVSQSQFSVSGPHKEHVSLTVEAPVVEYIQPTEVEPVLHPEVAESGVEVVEQQERPQISVEQKTMGVEHAKAALPVTMPQTQTVTLPYTPQQVVALEKTTKIEDSEHWLVTLTKYIMQKLQILGR